MINKLNPVQGDCYPPRPITVSKKLLGTLRSVDGNSDENMKKAIGLISRTTTLHVHHAFLYIS